MTTLPDEPIATQASLAALEQRVAALEAGAPRPPSGESAPGTELSTSGTMIESPLVGTVTAGNWQFVDRPKSGISGGQFHFGVLLPHGYSTAREYPVLVYEHTNMEGNQWYQGRSNGLVNVDRVQNFNSVNFRTRYPCIVLLPFCDQTDGTAGVGKNFGGYNDAPGSGVNEQAVAEMVQWVWQTYSCYQPKTFITGDSLGGHGSTAALLDYNAINGPVGRIFTAAAPYSGQIYRSSVQYSGGTFVDKSIPQRMASVPLFCVSGKGDTTSPPENFNRPMWRDLAGNSNFPGPNGARAGGSQYVYLEDQALGHDVWSAGNAYRLWPGCIPIYDWLYRKRNADPTQSAGKIIDRKGDTWALTYGQQIVHNGAVDPNTEAVTLMIYDWDHAVRHRNVMGGWWAWNGTNWIDSADPRSGNYQGG